MSDKETHIPEWLEEIQNRSWNPELLISGLSIVFLYTLESQVSEFSIWLVQRFGLNPVLVYFASVYVAVAFSALKWTLTLHLMLRGLWVAWLGLSYVYPNGIVFEKLPKSSQKEYIKRQIASPASRVILLEKVCSSIFGIAFTVVGLSLFILFFFIIAFVLDMLGVKLLTNSIILLVTWLLISLIVPLNHLLSKWRGVDEIKLLSRAYKGISNIFGILFFRDSMMTFQTNIPRINYYLSLMVLMLAFVLLSTSNIVATVQFVSFATENSVINNLKKKKKTKKANYLYNNYYLNRNTKERRIQKASIPSFRIQGNVLELFMANFKWDEKVFLKVVKTDTLRYKIDPLIDLKLNGKSVKTEWFQNEHPVTGQEGWVTYLPIDKLTTGKNNLQLDKWLWDPVSRKEIFKEKYCMVPFWKE